MLTHLDIWLWNLLIPKMNVNFFKNKFNALLVMVYISFYKLPRMFLLNYFSGKKKIMKVDSKQLIIRNPAVLDRLSEVLQSYTEKDNLGGSLHISQTDVDDPNYRYSVGSFQINYSREKENILLTIHSDYRFQESPERLTKYLHHWLYWLKETGKANEFRIEGNEWVAHVNELNSLAGNNKTEKSSRIRLLV